jgi:AmmeMemoRadiSam system protein A
VPALDAPVGPITDLAADRLPPPVELTDDEREALIETARLALATAAAGAPELALRAAFEGAGPNAAEPDALAEREGGAFVTLWEGGELRGCIGTLDASAPLRRSVALAAVGAALHDPRFRPVTEFELPAIELEVSVLGEFRVLDDPLEFRLSVDGLFITRGFARGLLLPDVATTHGFDHLEMLEATCRKASLEPDAWRLPGTTVAGFQTARISGPALPGGRSRG